MKKLIVATGLTSILTNASTALAQVTINVTPPPQAVDASLSEVISNLIGIVIGIAALVVLFFLIYGAFVWITSGGDKEQVGKARGIILNAIIGLVIIALAFVIITVIGNLLGFNPLDVTLPSLEGS